MKILAIATAVLIAANVGFSRAAELEASETSFNLNAINLSDIQKDGSKKRTLGAVSRNPAIGTALSKNG